MARTFKIFFALMAMVALFSLTACKSDAEKLIGLYEDMAEIIDSNKDDCDKMGEELEAFSKEHGDEFKELEKKLKDMSEEEQKELEKKYEERLGKAMEKIIGGMLACADNEKVMKASESMGK